MKRDLLEQCFNRVRLRRLFALPDNFRRTATAALGFFVGKAHNDREDRPPPLRYSERTFNRGQRQPRPRQANRAGSQTICKRGEHEVLRCETAVFGGP